MDSPAAQPMWQTKARSGRGTQRNEAAKATNALQVGIKFTAVIVEMGRMPACITAHLEHGAQVQVSLGLLAGLSSCVKKCQSIEAAADWQATHRNDWTVVRRCSL